MLTALLTVAVDIAVAATTNGATYPRINLTQVARGDFSSLKGKWVERAYAYNPQNGTGEQWVFGSPNIPATLTVSPSKLVFGPARDTVVTHQGLTYPTATAGPSRYLPLRWTNQKNVVTASPVNQMVAINYEVSVYPKAPGANFYTNNGVRLSPKPTVVLWSSNNGFTLVFQR
jgi:hypothetical protein